MGAWGQPCTRKLRLWVHEINLLLREFAGPHVCMYESGSARAGGYACEHDCARVRGFVYACAHVVKCARVTHVLTGVCLI